MEKDNQSEIIDMPSSEIMDMPSKVTDNLTKIADNLYCAEIPLPNNPLRYINVYIIKGAGNAGAAASSDSGNDSNSSAGGNRNAGAADSSTSNGIRNSGRSLIIDTGFNRPECEEALRGALSELGITDGYDIFVTHLHSDHVGLVPKLAQPDSTIYAGETDGEIINFEAGNLYWQILDDLFLTFGFPKAEFGRNTDIHPGRKYVHDRRIDFTYVDENSILEYGGYRLQPVLTPGHTPGHMCLYDKEKKLLLCGDHILGTITPNITIEICSLNPLKDYLESLHKIEMLDVQTLLPAHGTPIPDMYERIRELYSHHKNRLAEAESILGDTWKNAYETARDMTWEIDCRNWDEFPKPQKWFATGEAISHLQYLYGEGRAERREENGVWIYRRKA